MLVLGNKYIKIILIYLNVKILKNKKNKQKVQLNILNNLLVHRWRTQFNS